MNDEQEEQELSLKMRVMYGYHCRCLTWRFYRNLRYLTCFSLVVFVFAIAPLFSPPLWLSACLGLYVGWLIGLMYANEDRARKLSWDYLAITRLTPKMTYDEALKKWWELRSENDFVPEPLQRIADIRTNLAFEDITAPYEEITFRVRVYGWIAGCVFK